MTSVQASAYAEGYESGKAAAIQWQPIETAPKDGTRILAVGGGLTAVCIVAYLPRTGAWDAGDCTLDDYDNEPQGYSRPTHWRSLPEPPTNI